MFFSLAISFPMPDGILQASYYGITGVVQNFIKNPLPEGGNGAGAVAPGAAGTNQSAGALGRGSVQSSACYK